MKENNLIRKICFILAIIVVIIIAMYAYNKAKIKYYKHEISDCEYVINNI